MFINRQKYEDLVDKLDLVENNEVILRQMVGSLKGVKVRRGNLDTRDMENFIRDMKDHDNYLVSYNEELDKLEAEIDKLKEELEANEATIDELKMEAAISAEVNEAELDLQKQAQRDLEEVNADLSTQIAKKAIEKDIEAGTKQLKSQIADLEKDRKKHMDVIDGLYRANVALTGNYSQAYNQALATFKELVHSTNLEAIHAVSDVAKESSKGNTPKIIIPEATVREE